MHVIDLDSLRSALDQHAIVSITDVEGNIIYVNDKFCEISGFSRKELIGENHRMLKSGEHSDDMYVYLWKTIANGRVWNGEIKNRRNDGNFYWVKATVVPVLGDDGKPFQYISIRTDITKRKEIDILRSIQMKELDFQKTALDLHAIVSITDVKGDIIYANDKFCEISGFSRQELTGCNHRILKSGEHSNEMYANLWKTISNGEVWNGEIKNLKKDGSPYWVQATIVPFLDELGKPFQYVSIRTDITKSKQKEVELKDSIDELVAKRTAEINLKSEQLEKALEGMKLRHPNDKAD